MNLELAKAQYELQCEKKSKEDIYKLVDTVFKNRNFVHYASEYKETPMVVPNGYMTHKMQTNSTVTTSVNET